MIYLRCASFSNLPIVAEMPLPISAAFLAKSDLLTRPSPFAADFCASLSSDFLCALALLAFWRRCAWARTDLNSAVRSWIEATAILQCFTVQNLYPGLRPARLVCGGDRGESRSCLFSLSSGSLVAQISKRLAGVSCWSNLSSIIRCRVSRIEYDIKNGV